MGLKKRILICGGGTAGHIYPAVSIIESVQSSDCSDPGIDIFYIGTKKGLESRIIPPLGVDFYPIKAKGIKKSKSPFSKAIILISFFSALLSGFFRSLSIMAKVRPDIVLGMGGYVCAPVLLAGIFMRKKIALQEQNLIPGRLNLFFSRFADKVFLSFDESKKYFKKRPHPDLVYAGNPVRKAISASSSIKPPYEEFGLENTRFTVVCFGGSLGAKNINLKVLDSYKDLKGNKDLQFLLLSGKRFHEESVKVLESYRDPSDDLIFSICPYVEEMEKVYALADLVISRSGANTVAELQRTNIPSILIPYPEAIADHQYLNARYMESKGSAILVDDRSLASNTISGIINRLMAEDMKEYLQMKEKCIDDESMDSAKMIIDNLLEGVK